MTIRDYHELLNEADNYRDTLVTCTLDKENTIEMDRDFLSDLSDLIGRMMDVIKDKEVK